MSFEHPQFKQFSTGYWKSVSTPSFDIFEGINRCLKRQKKIGFKKVKHSAFVLSTIKIKYSVKQAG